MITSYKIFEGFERERYMINHILKLPLDVRIELKGELENYISNRKKIESEREALNENFIEELYDDLAFKFKDWLHEKILLWLLNQSEDRLKKHIDLLNLFDPTDFSNIKKCDVIYLGGGIDKTPDEYQVLPIKMEVEDPMALVGAKIGLFQNIVDKIKEVYPDKFRGAEPNRNVFIVDRGTDLSLALSPQELNNIEMIAGGGSWRFQVEDMIGEEHVIPNEDLLVAERTGVLDVNKYKKPAIINPLRKEQSVRDDGQFRDVYAKWKRGELDDVNDDSLFKYMAKVINMDIKQPDLRLLNVCDSNLVKYDAVAGDGTKGELQFGALKHYMNVFIWLDNGYNVKDISPWTFPEATKIVRNEVELELLIESIKKFHGIN